MNTVPSALQVGAHAVRVDRTAERLACVLRVSAGFVSGVLCLLALLLGRTRASDATVALGASLVVTLVSAWRLRSMTRGAVRHAVVPYLMSAIDVTFVLCLVLFAAGGVAGATGPLLLMGGLCAAIAVSVHYHAPLVVVHAGGSSVLAYAVFLAVRFDGDGLSIGAAVQEFAAVLVLLALATVLGRNVAGYLSDTLARLTTRLSYADALVQRLPVAVFTLDREGRLAWVSHGARELLGGDGAVLAGKTLGEVLDMGGDAPSSGSACHGTWQVKGGGAVARHVECLTWAAPVGSVDAFWEGLMIDVSERVRAERERGQMLERLHRYQKMESLGTLAGGMAHDFNNVLQRVVDAIRDVSRGTQETEVRSRMETAEQSLGEAKALVAQLLSLGSSSPISFAAVPVDELIRATIQSLGPHMGQAVALVHSPAGCGATIRGDRDHLRRVLENLIGNARDSMPEGGTITVSCSLGTLAGGAEAVIVRVRDTGSGIPSDMVDRIFDPFVTTKPAGKGTGLGLALVQHIMNLHKGSVSVETTGPQGTTFRLEFPSAPTLEVDHDTRWMVSRRQRTHVLVLDDDAKIREILCVFLRDLKYDVSEARNLEQARAQLDRNRATCRIVLMDWRIEGEEPQEVVASLRSIKSDVICIVVSGYAPDQRAMEKLKIWRWFTKPYDRNLLDVEIQRALYLAGRERGQQVSRST